MLFGSIYLGRVWSCDDPGAVSIVVILYWEVWGGDDATRATELTATHRSWKKRDKSCSLTLQGVKQQLIYERFEAFKRKKKDKDHFSTKHHSNRYLNNRIERNVITLYWKSLIFQTWDKTSYKKKKKKFFYRGIIFLTKHVQLCSLAARYKNNM